MTTLGKSSAEVGEMTVADAEDLFAYWRRIPPVAETMLAAFGGGDPGPQEKPREYTEAELKSMADLMNGRR